ncbi:hypothetical protein GOBAR_DD24106 [Gossypium barbadense]|nr:hypothetical protein GOBAR_DD24106 [Gossypium barbadense]
MWRLKIGEETVGNDGAWLRSVNNHVGRQVWEFCPQLGTPEKLSQVETARKTFSDHRFHKIHSSDLFLRIQNRDGGWGLHIEGQSTMFGTAMNYVTFRLLGKEAEGEAVERGREWILRHGTATAISSWGKVWLSVLGANEWCE